jgi:RNA polymerase sigma-70 factor (ECF subfamily)
MTDHPVQKTARSEVAPREIAFTGLLEADRRRLYAYIFAYVGDKAAADDIFQETSLALWRDFDRFEPGTSFSKWANGIAFNRVRSHRRKAGRMPQLLSEDVLETLDTRHHDMAVELDERWTTLQDCVGQLPESQATIYEDFYRNNKTAQDLVESTGRSIFAIRKAIHKLRKQLFDCVGKKRNEGS